MRGGGILSQPSDGSLVDSCELFPALVPFQEQERRDNQGYCRRHTEPQLQRTELRRLLLLLRARGVDGFEHLRQLAVFGRFGWSSLAVGCKDHRQSAMRALDLLAYTVVGELDIVLTLVAFVGEHIVSSGTACNRTRPDQSTA